ncbi:4-hydroxy-tetrahydrodipicolinate reductase [Paracoccaceae bacterium]|nr:4-hydroxy-tetrahydrodipicolinate reductase [Paracoccaceae bacterium]
MKNHFKVSVLGASGRMGSQIIKIVSDHPTMDLNSVVEHKGHNWIGQDCGEKLLGRENNVFVTDDLNLALGSADAVIDFTTPDNSLECLKICAHTNTAHIIGTTGFDPIQESKINEYAKKVVVVKAGNMSLGINILTSLVEKISSSLDPDFDTEILEMHHRNKVDAPSGTALMLGEAAAKGKGKNLSELRGAVREGTFGSRDEGSIGFASLRGGGIVGEHEVSFTSESERISIKHEAFSRDIFVKGAIKAALWSKEKKPGLYDMLSVLNLR